MGNLFGRVRTPQEELEATCAAMRALANESEREARKIQREADVARRNLENAQDDKDREGVRMYYTEQRSLTRRAADYRTQARLLRETQDGLFRTRADAETKLLFAKAAGAVQRIQARLPPDVFQQTIQQYSINMQHMASEVELARETLADTKPDSVSGEGEDSEELNALLGQISDDLLDDAPSVGSGGAKKGAVHVKL